MGKVLEDAREYEASFRCYERGNAIQDALVQWPEEIDRRLVTSMLEHFSHGPTVDMPRGVTPIFIVGMPRSGTTLIEQVLSCCPNVYAGGELQCMPIALNAALDKAKDNFAAVDLETLGQHYLTQISNLSDKRYVVDKLPGNWMLVGLIRRAMPHAKIVHATRDAMDTCFSLYARLFAGGNLPFAYDLRKLGRYYNLYQKTMQTYKDAFYETQYESMVGDLEQQARSLLAYLEIPWSDSCLRFWENDRPVKTASKWQVKRPMYDSSIGRAQNYKEWLNPLAQALLAAP
jgi:hypothetical protein